MSSGGALALTIRKVHQLHHVLNTPVLIRSLKLSNIESWMGDQSENTP